MHEKTSRIDREVVDSLLAEYSTAQKADDSTRMLNVLEQLAMKYDKGEKYDSAQIFYNRGIKMAESLGNDKIVCDMKNNLGNIYLYWGSYEKALELYLESLAISKRNNDSISQSKTLNNIGIIYYDWGDMEQSLDYYMQSFRLDSAMGNVLGESQTLNNIAIIYDETGEDEKALEVYQRSLDFAREVEDYYQIAVAYSNIGGVYLEEKDFVKADTFYRRTLENYQRDRSVIGIAETYILLGDLYSERGQYEEALDYFRRGLEIVIPRNLTWSILNAYQSLETLYKKRGDHKKAYEYLKKYHKINDSIFSAEASSKLALLTNAYEIQQKDQEMELQQARMNEQHARIKRQRIIMSGLGVFTITIVIFSILLFRQYRLRIKAWRHLLAQHEDILKSRQEVLAAKEKAEESDRLKTTFLVNVSHELRTPMNGIMGFTELLQREAASEEKRKLYLSYISSSSRQLLKVLNDIIDISSIETGQLRLEEEACSPKEIFSDLYAFYQKQKEEENKDKISLKLSVPDDAAEHHCIADRKRLAQVVFNLLSNALRFTEKGRIEFGYSLDAGSTMQIFVRDTGIGIERSKFELIFERFRQIDDSTTRTHGGAGLGLAIAKELVKLMKGKIYVESELGRGSTFFVEIPFVTAEVRR